MAITAGTYTIRSAMDPTIVLDVEGNSTASGANIELWSDNGGLNQVWDVQRASSTYCRIVSARSGLLVDSSNAVPANGRNILQYRDTGGDNQQWAIADSGQTIAVNGAAYPLYRIESRMDRSYCMDASGEGSAPGTNVILWRAKDPAALNQLWLLMPTSIPSARLLAPSSGGVSASAQSGGSRTLATAPTATAVYPSWVGTGSSWQVRYRTATRGVSDADVGAWSAWKCLADGSTANGGWGAVGTVEPVTASGGRIRATHGIPIVLGSTNDKVELRFEARRFEADFEAGFDAHGTAASFKASAVTHPSLSIDSLVWTPDGVRLTPATERGGASYVLEIDGITKQPMRYSGVQAGDYLHVPSDMLAAIPANGESYTVRLSLTTADGAAAKSTGAVACAYSASSGLTISPSFSEQAHGVRTVDLSAYPKRNVWVVSGGEAHPMRESGGVFWIAPPQGVPYSIFVQVENQAGAWGAWHADYPAVAVDGHLLTYEGGTLRIGMGLGKPPSASWRVRANTSSSFLTGGIFEATAAGEGLSEVGVLQGSEHGDPAGIHAAADSLLEAVYAWYRGDRGELIRVAAESANVDEHDWEWADVSVTMRRTDD
ncbi:hypothetical protein EII22_09025 [Coriobacteriales bacterium OH1046]|nr:hypothetical protein EII22_09025 [Coriobacteriales bacterium OH1046]